MVRTRSQPDDEERLAFSNPPASPSMEIGFTVAPQTAGATASAAATSSAVSIASSCILIFASFSSASSSASLRRLAVLPYDRVERGGDISRRWPATAVPDIAAAFDLAAAAAPDLAAVASAAATTVAPNLAAAAASAARSGAAAAARSNAAAISGTAVAGQRRDMSPPRSTRSYGSTARRLRLAELEAAEKLAKIRMQELKIEADLIRKRLEYQRSEADEQSLGDRDEPIEEGHRRVVSWLDEQPTTESRPTTETTPRATYETAQRATHDRRHRSPTSPRTDRRGSAIEQLANSLEKMARARPHARQTTELPSFSGAHTDWLAFKAAMQDTTRLCGFTPTENLARLRNCLHGEAKEAVSALLHSDTHPDLIMRTLEQCFGRPEIIIQRTMAEFRKLPRLGTTANELNMFAVKIQNVVCVIQSLDRKGYLHNPMLMGEILDKMTPLLKTRWCDYARIHEGSPDPEIVLLSRFLMNEADAALRYASVSAYPSSAATVSNTTRTTKPAQPKQTAPPKRERAIYTTTEAARDKCRLCDAEHKMSDCATFKRLSVDERWQIVRERRLCFLCVNSTHRRGSCRAKRCNIDGCKRPHHVLLHTEAPQTTPPVATETATAAPTAAATTTEEHRQESVLSIAASHEERIVLLKVCPVTVTGPRGKMDTFALLDEGATISLIDEDLTRMIGADGPASPLEMRGVNMRQNETRSRAVNISIKGKDRATAYTLKARTIKDLSLRRQEIPMEMMKYDHLRGLGTTTYDEARPRILVGADHWHLIVTRDLRLGKPNEPAASNTELGWVIHGTAPRVVIRRDEDTTVLHLFRTEQSLHELVDTHFRIDALGVSTKKRTSDADRRALDIFNKTLKKIDGGYEVGLLWRNEGVRMPSSYNTALKRLRNLEDKMSKSPELAVECSKQIQNLLNKGYAEESSPEDQQSPICWYLPHFAVTNENKPGKVRLVHDAAARSNGVSLNDQLLQGPDLLLSLQGILFRFRERPVAVAADIAEMYMRVKIRKEDQPAQQFLWRTDRSEPPQRFKMTSMIFGASSSPFLAHSVRNYNARRHEASHPRALMAIAKNHYMDDYVDSYNDEDEAVATVTEIMEVHKVAGFELRGWNANRMTTLRNVPTELWAKEPARLGAGAHDKILGLYWNRRQDELGFNTAIQRLPAEVMRRQRAPTKRETLSAVMSIYDPLGLLSHFTVRAKILLQRLWRENLGWDEPIPDREAEEFAQWFEQLNEIATLRLPRCYTTESFDRIELHVFCDASEQAYAAAAFWRFETRGGIKVTLAAAKSKVAPKKTQSIPRLELQAAVIGARLAETIRQEHRLKAERTIYWTDSTTVIQWIKNDNLRCTPFVTHRLAEIDELTSKDEVQWIATGENVADDATRLHHEQIKSSDRWFLGPEFLYEEKDRWPEQRIFETPERGEDVLHTSNERENSREGLPETSRFSSFERLVRTTAYVLLFVEKLRRRATTLELRHLQAAEKLLLQASQQDSFPSELENLRKEKIVPASSTIRKLDPILKDGLLRVRGRIGNAEVPTHTKEPIILHGKHPIARLLVMKQHYNAGHANRERVTNDLRQRYWIVGLRPTVRAAEKECAVCRVRKACPEVPAPGDLPAARMDPYHRPFTNCGVDYFGPYMVRIGRRREKRWCALFTCMRTRAVHLEIVPSLSTDSALMALRRMAARRGWPALMMSDNGTNFRGADHELQKAYEEWAPALADEALTRRMEWKFIPPGAPHMGGAWERLVRSVKTALAATLKERAPTEEVLMTLLVEAEHAVNGRPLTHVPVDPADLEALTPNHFLLGSSTGMPTTGECHPDDRRTWRAAQALADAFWKRWVREYLPTLIARRQPRKNERRLQAGDVVVVIDPNLPRNTWPIGIVERSHPGKDGSTRSADIRTKGGVFCQPVTRIAVLVEGDGQEKLDVPEGRLRDEDATPGGACKGRRARDACATARPYKLRASAPRPPRAQASYGNAHRLRAP